MFRSQLSIGRSTVVLLLLPVIFLAAGAFAQTPEKGPVNPAFLDWLADKGGGANTGYIPSPLDWSHLTASSSKDTPPLQYDLRNTGGLTSVKNQGACGSCWSHAVCSSLESWLKITDAEVFDFSENHMKNNHGFALGHCAGGNNYISMAYLARWEGPLLESEDPYDPTQSVPLAVTPPPQKLMLSSPIFTIEGGDRTEVQSAIMAHGALSTSIYWGDPQYNSGSYTYYSTQPQYSDNHMVSVVGWDDAKVVPAAPGPGAWICKNSWGSSWGESGFFYISYYDTIAVQECVAFINLVDPDTYGSIYHYDPLGLTSFIGWGNSIGYGANVFTAVADESIAAVGTYAVADNTAYEITVYNSGISGGNFYNPVTTTSGVFVNAGYHVVALPSVVNVSLGQQFSVKVRYQTPGWNYPLPLESPQAGYAAATAASGQSYMSSDGTDFVDTVGQSANTNVCIKAIAAAPDKTVRIIGKHWVEEGSQASFTASLPVLVGATTFEWYKDNVLIVGAESDSYVIPAVVFGDAGMYKLIVTDESKEILESAPLEMVVLATGSLPVSGTAALIILSLILSAAGVYLRFFRRNTCEDK